MSVAPPGFLPRGLLATTGQWTLPQGISQARPLRFAARGLLGLASAMLALWWFALVAEGVSGQGSWGRVSLACAVALAWLGAIWPLFGIFGQSGTVTLRWGGLPPFRPKSRPAQHQLQLFGWSIDESQDAVSVHVVFDLGAWLLIKMVSVQKGSAARDATWSWLEARHAFQGVDGHHLRALLFNRRANLANAVVLDELADSATMASSGHNQPSSSKLRLPSFKQSAPSVSRGIRQHRAGLALGAASAVDAFADTVVDERSVRT